LVKFDQRENFDTDLTEIINKEVNSPSPFTREDIVADDRETNYFTQYDSDADNKIRLKSSNIEDSIFDEDAGSPEEEDESKSDKPDDMWDDSFEVDGNLDMGEVNIDGI